MKTVISTWLAACIVVVSVMPLAAHHPFTPYFDASKFASVTGTIAEFRYQNPHVVLIVEGPGPGGRTGRWAFEGKAPNAFRTQGVNVRTRLTMGLRVTVSGWHATDPSVPVFAGYEVTFADGSKMSFGTTPQQHDQWHCLSPDPCPYKYPDVGP